MGDEGPPTRTEGVESTFNEVFSVRTALLTLLVLMAAVGSVLSQTKDFSGKWVVDAEKTAAAAPKPELRYPTTEIQITMDETMMRIVSKGPAGTRQTTYRLDGATPTSNLSVSGRSGAPGDLILSTAKWDGALLVVTTKLHNGDGVQKYSLDGPNLKIDYKSPDARARIAIYKKAS